MSATHSRVDLEAGFDAFYKDSRDRLLLQTYALTGDLGAARSAVRDAYVVGWHHWRKVHRLDDPESSVRPIAWRNAIRRATARPWRREKGRDPEHEKTLEALSGLPVTQRKALLLSQLATVPMVELAREVGLPADSVQRELQTATAQFAIARSVPSSSIPLLLSNLGDAVRGVTWPRATIIRRAGAARRRAHTLVGAVVVVLAMLGSGALVTDATGVRASLDRELPASPTSGGPVTAGPEISLPDTSLLPVEDVRQGLVGSWFEGGTSDNSTGNGLVLPCQRERYADPEGHATWVRKFRNGQRGEATRFVTQVAEASADERSAGRTFNRLRRWVAGCSTPGMHLVSTAVADEVGDESAVLLLSTAEPAETFVVAIARSGLFTTALGLETDVPPARADRQAVANLLSQSVNRLCRLPDGGACGQTPPALEDVPPFPAGPVPAMLSPIDLPPVGDPGSEWVGTRPQQITGGRTDLGVLGCDTVDLGEEFEGRALRADLVRTFVKPGSELPPEFGLTQAVGSLPADEAGAFLARFRDEVSRCPDEEAGAGTDVRLLQRLDDEDRSFSAWHLTTELPREQTVEYGVAVVRSGGALSQLVFISAADARMSDADFVALVERSLTRLGELPKYRR